MVSKYFHYDHALLIRALGGAALTADGYVGTQWDQGAAVITDAVCRVTVEEIDVAGGDERYVLYVAGSNIADRSDARILAAMELGDAAAVPVDTVDTAVGDVVDIRFRTERNDTAFRYIDLYLDGTGASFSIKLGAHYSKEF